MANPAADYPAALHTATDISAYVAAFLGGSAITHTDVHGKIEQEILAIETKLGIGSSAASSATTGQSLVKGATNTAWANVNSDNVTEGSTNLFSKFKAATYGSLVYVQPKTTTQGLVIGSNLHTSVPTAFTQASAFFNGDISVTNNGANYFLNLSYGTSIAPFGGLFGSGRANGTAAAPTQVLAGHFLGAHIFTAMGNAGGWAISGASHIVPGLWAAAALDATTTLEQDIWLGGVITKMIGIETDTNNINFNEAQLDANMTFYYDVGTAMTIDGGTGIVAMPKGASITPRVSSETSSATPTINTDNVDAHSITALATAITSMTSSLSGTPVNFQKLIIRIKDDGTARAITWGASFEAKGVALPTTTVISKVLTVGFLYDTVSAKWGCVAAAQEA